MLSTWSSSYASFLSTLVISSNTLAFIVHLLSFTLEFIYLQMNSLFWSSSLLPNTLIWLFYRHLKLSTSQIKCILPPKSLFFSCFSDITFNSVKSGNSEWFLIPHKCIPLIACHALLSFSFQAPLQSLWVYSITLSTLVECLLFTSCYARFW